MTEEREDRLRALQTRLGHDFSNLGLLEQALTHSSLANERPGAEVAHNEPLEFLGDAVLGFLVAASRFVLSEYEAEIAEGLRDSIDFKSALQERLQARGAPVPAYVVVEEQGPSHQRTFRVHCVVEGRVVA